VYNRVGRGERVFDRGEEAEAFVSLLREVVERDGLTVFAWCVMSNHYHLALRTGVIGLDRPMRSLQQRVKVPGTLFRYCGEK
jgi:putative transposase